MLALVSHPWELFIVFLVGLTVVVDLGLRLRLMLPNLDEERRSLIKSARDGMTVFLSFLLGFALPMALPNYERRSELVTQEANAIATVHDRAQLLPEPFRSKLRALLGEYVDARLDFAHQVTDQAVLASAARAKVLQSQMWQQGVAMAQQNPVLNTAPIFLQSLGAVSDLSEERLAAYERRIPATIWLVLALISVLTCFVVGYSMGRRLWLTMVVLPLTVAIVLSLVSELDSPRSGFIRAGQQSMERLQLDLKTDPAPNQ